MRWGLAAVWVCGLGAAWALSLAAPSPPAPSPARPQVLSPYPDNLEGEWFFRTDPEDVGEREGWHLPDYQETGWRRLRVPGGWEEQGVTDTRPGEPPRTIPGVRWTDYDGVAWYRLRVVVPKSWARQPLLLRLGAVDDFDRAYLNGQLVGETSEGGAGVSQIQREYRVPPEAVRPGEVNVIAVRVTDNGGPGGLLGPSPYLLPEKAARAPVRLPQANRPLARRFANPPAASRILKIIHGWPDAAADQDRLIRSLANQGFGGVVCNVSWDQYLESDEKWRAFTRAVKQAKQAGMTLWLYDEKGYPSATAGGLTLRGHPEWQARGLLVADTRAASGRVELDLPPGDLVFAAAFPVSEGRIDLERRVDLAPEVSARKLAWEPPPGQWHVMAVTEGPLHEGSHATMSLSEHIPYPNLLMPEPTRRFLELTHERYAERLGRDLGKWFVSTFTDEPSLMSLFIKPMPYRPLPWSPTLASEFRKRRGYELKPLLPALVAEAGPRGMRARHDFWLTVAELVSESFFGQIQEWCRAHKVRSGGHLLMEEGLLPHVPLYGDFLRCVRRLDAPSIDCLTSVPAEVPWSIARLVSSAAELEGREVTMCETSDFGQTYRPEGDTRPVRRVTPEEIRGTCNRLMLGGITTITSYYTFAGLSSRQLRELNLHVGRCATLLAGGHQVADVAVLYPVESVWPRYRPARHMASDSPAANPIESAFRAASDGLYEAGRDFTYVDSRALSEAKVDRGALAHGKLRWRVLVLPAADTLPLRAWEKVAAFARSGGVVVAMGALPANSSTEFPSPRVQAIAREVFGQPKGLSVRPNPAGGAGVFLPAGTEALLPDVVNAALAPDVRVSDPKAPLRVTHRRVEGHDVYFLINDGSSPWRGTVGVSALGAGELWDPATGKSRRLPGPTRIRLSLQPYGAVLLRFARGVPPRRLPLRSGALRGLAATDLPPVEPTVGMGEHVRGGFVPWERPALTQRPAWLTRATLSKGQVDTHLFVSFDYPQGAGLAGAESLVLETWVPEGQETSAQLLVILHDRDGGDYLAETGRSLGSPGTALTYIPISRFRPAGWATDPNGRLDLDQVTALRVGWGGYIGTEGETIELGLSRPKAGRRRG